MVDFCDFMFFFLKKTTIPKHVQGGFKEKSLRKQDPPPIIDIVILNKISSAFKTQKVNLKNAKVPKNNHKTLILEIFLTPKVIWVKELNKNTDE